MQYWLTETVHPNPNTCIVELFLLAQKSMMHGFSSMSKLHIPKT